MKKKTVSSLWEETVRHMLITDFVLSIYWL